MSKLLTTFTETLMRTQSLEPEALQRYQDRLTTMLVAHAARQVPFYRDTGRLSSIFDDKTGNVDLTRWHEVPILTREEAQEAGERLRAESTPPEAGNANLIRTSGSTGTPFIFLQSAALFIASKSCTHRHLKWFGLDESSAFAQMRHGRPPAPDSEDGVRSEQSNFHLYDVAHRSDDPLDWLRKTGVNNLISYPTYAGFLARKAAAEDRLPLHLEHVFCFGEVLDDDVREDVTRAFNTQVVDRYASEECGMIAGECVENRLHIQSETNRLEIVDHDGQSITGSAIGRVIVTSLYNYATPLIRYDTGDFGTRNPTACRCGIKLPTLGKILGRSRQMFHLPDGRSIWPVIPFSRLQEFVEMRQMQIAQTRTDHLEVRYVPKGAHYIDQVSASAFVKKCLEDDKDQIAVDFKPVAHIPRSSSGKFFDFISEV
ncbi:phenylacetate--CoA ligase family protein [Rhizobium sp. PAMB 3174]